jgi:hypothetical protein
MTRLGSVTPDSAKFSKESKGDKEDKEDKEDAVDPRRTFQYLYNFEEKKFSPLSATINTFGTRKPTNAMVTEGSSFGTLCWSTQKMMGLFPEVDFYLLNARRGNFNWDCSPRSGPSEHPMLKQANETWSRAKIELVTSNDCATAFGEQNASSIFKVLAKLHQLFNLDSGPRSIN